MNRSLLFFLAIFCGLNATAQSVFYEDFENGITSQFVQDQIVGALDWVTDPNAVFLGPSDPTFEGDSSAHFYAGGYTGDISTLTTPTLGLSAGGYRLSFAHVQPNWVGDQNTLSIYHSGDDGATWTLIDSIVGDIQNYVEVEYALDNYVTTTSTSKIRFSGWIDYGYSIGLDVVNIFLPESNDAELASIVAPANGCGLGSEMVTIEVYNNGLAPILSVDASYELNNMVETETFTTNIASGQSAQLTFTVPVDLSVAGTYSLSAWINLTGDLNAMNDSASSIIESIPVVSSLPYLEDFENGAGGWTSGGVLNPWELGDPETAFIDTANSGINAWVTNLDGTYEDGTDAYVESPCFDLSALVIDPIFRFAFISNSEISWDGTWVEVSTDAGITWNTVGNFGEGTNWYTAEDEHGANFNEDWWDAPIAEAGVWTTATHLLDGAAGSGSVKIRVFFHSDGSVNEGYDGFAFDDVELFEQPAVNAAVFAVTGPTSTCGLTATETVSVTISNLGSVGLDSLVVSYSLNNGPVQTEVFYETLAVGNSTNVSFASTIDLSALTDHQLMVWVDADGDGDNTNDTASVTITSVPTISSMPYFQDFEAGNGGWRSEGLNLEWQLGDPIGNLIDNAFSGVNAWATNLNQLNYENEEYSILYSPCFDLSTMTADPVISFAIIHDSEQGWDGTWLEISTDGGTTWDRVGNTGEGENWYTNSNFFNGLIDQGWDGQSGNGVEWVTTEHILEGAAGNSNVMVRFIFTTDLSVNFYEGFAIDDISIRAQAELDLVVLSFEGPGPNCSLGDEQVSFRFWNKGLQTVSNFPVGFRADGGTAQFETYTGSVAQFDTVTYTFTTQLANLSATGMHTIDVFTALVGDEYSDSDSLLGSTVENHGNLTPFTITDEPGAFISSTLPQGTTSQMFFCGLPNVLDGCFQIASVTIDSINHTWLSDLSIYLISPAGDSVELSTGNGGGGDGMSNVIFTDASTNNITLQVNDILPGEYHPQDPMGFEGLYNGQDPNGGWSLFIADLVGGDDGVLVSWTLSFTDNNPVPVINVADTSICLTQVLSVGVDQYDSYLWSTGANTQNVNLAGNVLGLGAHVIHVTVDNNGCTGVSNSFTLTVDACAGVEELGNLTIGTYPNPTSGELILDITGESNALSITLTDMHGKVVFESTTGAIRSGLKRAIDLSTLANGMYFMKLDDGNAAATRKVMKQ